ncbi:MAG: Fur family transcriptional regulator [Gudongella sp.]|jgi:Fur family ferric uptake transcriptional regulator|nr:Fur family transcriptional regulator [Gudongella sp.]
MKSLDRFYKILKENNYKLTDQRRVVFEAFLKHQNEHMTSEELYQYIIVDNPGVGLATVYRNVQLLSELKIIEKLTLNDGFTRYELALNEENHRHHHLICNNCGKVIEVREDLMGSIEKIFDENYGFLVSDHQTKFFGLCKECRGIE